MKEEKELRDYGADCSIYSDGDVGKRRVSRLITALIRAVRADEREKAANKCDEEAKRFTEFAEHARKKGHDVEDIVARRIACEDLAAAIREGKK